RRRARDAPCTTIAVRPLRVLSTTRREEPMPSREVTSSATSSSPAPRGLLLLLAAAVAACGPVYLHDPAGEAAATAARAQFQDTLAKGRMSDLVATYRAQTAEQTAATRALQQDNVRTQIFSLSAKPWAEVLSETKAELDRTKAATMVVGEQLSKLDQSLATYVQAREDAAKHVADLVQAVNVAAAAERRYAASQALLAAALRALLDRQGGTGTGQSALTDVLKATVKGRTFKLEDDVLVETSMEETVGAALGIDESAAKDLTSSRDPVESLKALVKGIKGLESFRGLQLGSTGIGVTIVGLGYDVARAEERRLGVLIDDVQRTRTLYRAQAPFLDEQQRRLERNLTQLQSLDTALRGVPEPK